MEKKYITPSIKVKKIDLENLLQTASPNSPNPTNGLDNAPGNGGSNDGSHSVNSKFNAWDTWRAEGD